MAPSSGLQLPSQTHQALEADAKPSRSWVENPLADPQPSSSPAHDRTCSSSGGDPAPRRGSGACSGRGSADSSTSATPAAPTALEAGVTHIRLNSKFSPALNPAPAPPQGADGPASAQSTDGQSRGPAQRPPPIVPLPSAGSSAGADSNMLSSCSLASPHMPLPPSTLRPPSGPRAHLFASAVPTLLSTHGSYAALPATSRPSSRNHHALGSGTAEPQLSRRPTSGSDAGERSTMSGWASGALTPSQGAGSGSPSAGGSSSARVSCSSQYALRSSGDHGDATALASPPCGASAAVHQAPVSAGPAGVAYDVLRLPSAQHKARSRATTSSSDSASLGGSQGSGGGSPVCASGSNGGSSGDNSSNAAKAPAEGPSTQGSPKVSNGSGLLGQAPAAAIGPASTTQPRPAPAPPVARSMPVPPPPSVPSPPKAAAPAPKAPLLPLPDPFKLQQMQQEEELRSFLPSHNRHGPASSSPSTQLTPRQNPAPRPPSRPAASQGPTPAARPRPEQLIIPTYHTPQHNTATASTPTSTTPSSTRARAIASVAALGRTPLTAPSGPVGHPTASGSPFVQLYGASSLAGLHRTPPPPGMQYPSASTRLASVVAPGGAGGQQLDVLSNRSHRAARGGYNRSGMAAASMSVSRLVDVDFRPRWRF